jgi:hypothetical protein
MWTGLKVVLEMSLLMPVALCVVTRLQIIVFGSIIRL